MEKIKLNKNIKKKAKKKAKAKRGPRNKYDNDLGDIFASYSLNVPVKSICEKYGMSISNFYRLKSKYKWGERRDEISRSAQNIADKDTATVKAEALKLINMVMIGALSGVLKKISEGTMDFKISDIASLMKPWALFNGEATERFEDIFAGDPDLIAEVAEELSPQERAVVVDVMEKIQKRTEEVQEERQLHLV